MHQHITSPVACCIVLAIALLLTHFQANTLCIEVPKRLKKEKEKKTRNTIMSEGVTFEPWLRVLRLILSSFWVIKHAGYINNCMKPLCIFNQKESIFIYNCDILYSTSVLTYYVHYTVYVNINIEFYSHLVFPNM